MKKQIIITKTISLTLLGFIFLTSCRSTTMIQSIPTGAKIYIDGQPVGTTPYLYSDTKIVGSETTVQLEKEGYEQTNVSFSRDEKADVGAIIGGIIVWFPFLWTMEYNPTHTYELAPITDNMNHDFKVESPQDGKSKADRLRELKQLLDEKILTQDEFEKEKKKILDEDQK